MAKRRKPDQRPSRRIPKVRLAKPEGRPIQLRYFCPVEKREIRISTGTHDEQDAERQKGELEAKLLLGIESKPGRTTVCGPEMDWSDFREQYRTLHLATVRDSSAMHAESRLDLAERIMKPRTLGDLADPNSLQQLQTKLLTGAESRRNKPRSPHTVKGYMNSILSAVNWPYVQGWLPVSPRLRRLKVGKLKAMKGRPISENEFAEMLKATPKVVGSKAAESWQHVLQGLWESALRLDELMHMSWDLPNTIRPVWRVGQLPVLDIPAALQKNDTEESIPLLPWFEPLLLKTPPGKRTGWVFNPISLQLKFGRRVCHGRPDAEWIGKVVSRIGKAAGIVVELADERTGRPTKYATAHDLRRSCGERLREAGVPPLVICRVMRHASWETTRKHYAPGNIQQDAEVLKAHLGTVGHRPETKTAGDCT
ncbi:MAG: tyrosine-type recombinase/integrase [Thermogutta sp.]